jgi:hypothetical protein
MNRVESRNLRGSRFFPLERKDIMTKLRGLLAILGLVAFALCAVNADEKKVEKKPVDLTMVWKGSNDDEKLMKDAPAVITTAKGLEKLWSAWKVEGKVPEVNFDKEIVVVTTTVGSKVSVFANLSDKGDLQVVGQALRDLRPGFRYVIATLPKEGVKTVNGKELPKE